MQGTKWVSLQPFVMQATSKFRVKRIPLELLKIFLINISPHSGSFQQHPWKKKSQNLPFKTTPQFSSFWLFFF